MSYNVDIVLHEIVQHNDSDYYCVPNSGQNFNNTAPLFATVDRMKEQYAIDPNKYLNIYITCQQPGPPMHGFGMTLYAAL